MCSLPRNTVSQGPNSFGNARTAWQAYTAGLVLLLTVLRFGVLAADTAGTNDIPSLQAENERLAASNAELVKENAEMRAEIAKMRDLLAWPKPGSTYRRLSQQRPRSQRPNQ